jgi:hypothetical protein
MRIARYLEVVVMLDTSLGSALWIDVNNITGDPAAVLVINLVGLKRAARNGAPELSPIREISIQSKDERASDTVRPRTDPQPQGDAEHVLNSTPDRRRSVVDSDLSEAELEVRGRRYTTAGWVASTLESIEYAYNLAALIQLANQGSVRDLSVPLRALRGSSGSGMSAVNSALRSSIPEDAQLRISSILATASFNIKLIGIADIIKALVSIFDPLARAKAREQVANAREQVRHAEAMNRLAEEDEMIKVTGNRLEFITKAFNDPQSIFAQIAQETLDEDGRAAIKQLVVQEFMRSVASLSGNSIRAISAPEPE